MAKSVDRELAQHVALLNPGQKKSILVLIKAFLQPAEISTRISREQYNKEIKEAEERISAGHYLTQEEVEKDAATW